MPPTCALCLFMYCSSEADLKRLREETWGLTNVQRAKALCTYFDTALQNRWAASLGAGLQQQQLLIYLYQGGDTCSSCSPLHGLPYQLRHQMPCAVLG